MSVADELAQRNEEFSRTRYNHALKIVPSLRTIIIGCVDPRVDPAEVLALKPGEAAIIRNVGGRVFPSTRQTIDMLVEVARANGGVLGKGWTLLVLHHTECGINALVKEPAMLADHFGLPPGDLPTMAVTDPVASVRVDCAALRADPRVARDVMISGMVYDVATGLTQTVVASG